jgi:Kef-type K+ transport system membrane component KefB
LWLGFFGWVFKKIGQPTVIGEIIAGIVLGPSLLGMYFPGFSAALFPVESLGNLKFLSQIGLILFMFVIGMELDIKVLKTKLVKQL